MATSNGLAHDYLKIASMLGDTIRPTYLTLQVGIATLYQNTKLPTGDYNQKNYNKNNNNNMSLYMGIQTASKFESMLYLLDRPTEAEGCISPHAWFFLS